MGQRKKVENGKTARFFHVDFPLLVYMSLTVSTFPHLHNLSLQRLKDVEPPASSLPSGIGCFLHCLRWGDRESNELDEVEADSKNQATIWQTS